MSQKSFSRRRVPQAYDGPRYTSVQMKDLLGKFVRRAQNVHDARGEELFQAWAEVIGPQIARMTHPKSFVEGILTVQVKNSTLLSLLVQKDKQQILQKLRSRFPKTKIIGLHFCMG